MSRQSKEQQRLKAQGLCTKCWQPAHNGRILCPDCMIKNRKSERRRLGCKPWRKGGRGRPPIYKEPKTKP